MSEKGNLYKTIIVRFSFINQEHVDIYKEFTDYCDENRLSRNQKIIDAMGFYCRHSMGEDETAILDKYKAEMERYAKEMREQLVRDVESEVRQSVMKELLSIMAGVGAGMPPASIGNGGSREGKLGRETQEEEPENDGIQNNPGIVESAMKWG